MGARDVLANLSGAGLSVTVDGDRLVVRPASRLTGPLREALRATKPELLALLRDGHGESRRPHGPPPWTDQIIAGFIARRDRLIRWGWSERDAEALAERLAVRDQQPDERVTCVDCAHYRPGGCQNFRAAGLNSSPIGRDLVVLPQRCPGFRNAR